MNVRVHRTRMQLAGILTLALLLSAASVVVAAPGDLDPSFDGDGKVITPFGAGSNIGWAVAIQPDGKIVVAGGASNGANNDFALARYLSDGSLDLSFDGDGMVMTDFGVGADTAFELALQTDGKIIAAGLAWNGSNRDFGLARYNADGSLDATFDGDGKVITAIGSGDDRGLGIALQADGKIVVAGSAHNGADRDFAVARYNANGSLDNTFDGDGKVVTAVSGAHDELFAVAVQADQNIVVAGIADVGPSADFALARYEASGVLDASFGSNGIVVSSIDPGSDYAQDITLQQDHKIVATGTIELPDMDTRIAVARYNPDGSFDTTFDGDGKVESISVTSAGGVAVQANGRIVVAGSKLTGENSDFAFERFNPDGSSAGSYTTPIAGSNGDSGTDVAIQTDGKIVIAGMAEQGDDIYAFAVARYLGDPPPPVLKTYLPLILR